MAILNISEDSFCYSCKLSDSEIISTIEKYISQGADIIDLGACSTRPNSTPVPEQEELDKLRYALNIITERFPDLIISVDTFRSKVADMVVNKFGVGIINDISGGQLDPEMFPTVAQLGVPYVLTHYLVQPLEYKSADEFISSVIDYFQTRIYQLVGLGVKDIIIDPGFGFGKTLQQNYILLNRLSDLRVLSKPILAGLSHKSMIQKVLSLSPQEATNGTTVLQTIALQRGADIVRTHDIQELAQTIKLLKYLDHYGNN